MEQQLPRTHGHHYDPQQLSYNPAGMHPAGVGGEDEGHEEKQSVFMMVKAKAKKIKNKLTKHGHGNGHDHDHDHGQSLEEYEEDEEEEEEDDLDEEMVTDPEIQGAPIYESAAVTSAAPAPGVGLGQHAAGANHEKPSLMAEDPYDSSFTDPAVKPFGQWRKEEEKHGCNLGRSGDEGINPLPEHKQAPLSRTEQGHGLGMSRTGEPTDMEEMRGGIGKYTSLEEDPHSPYDPDVSSKVQTKTIDPSGKVYESAAVRNAAAAPGAGLGQHAVGVNLEKPSLMAEDRYESSFIDPAVKPIGQWEKEEGKHNIDFGGLGAKRINPLSEHKQASLSRKEQGHGLGMSRTAASTNTEEKVTNFEEDPHGPYLRDFSSNVQAETIDPSGKGSEKEAVGITPILQPFHKMGVSDTADQKPKTGSHNQFAPEPPSHEIPITVPKTKDATSPVTMPHETLNPLNHRNTFTPEPIRHDNADFIPKSYDTTNPETMPANKMNPSNQSGTNTEKIKSAAAAATSAIANAPQSAKNVMASKLEQVEDNTTQSGCATRTSADYAHKIAATLTETRAPVAGAGSAVTSKVTGMGDKTSQVRNEKVGEDKGVSATRYNLEEKLKPYGQWEKEEGKHTTDFGGFGAKGINPLPEHKQGPSSKIEQGHGLGMSRAGVLTDTEEMPGGIGTITSFEQDPHGPYVRDVSSNVQAKTIDPSGKGSEEAVGITPSLQSFHKMGITDAADQKPQIGSRDQVAPEPPRQEIPVSVPKTKEATNPVAMPRDPLNPSNHSSTFAPEPIGHNNPDFIPKSYDTTNPETMPGDTLNPSNQSGTYTEEINSAAAAATSAIANTTQSAKNVMDSKLEQGDDSTTQSGRASRTPSGYAQKVASTLVETLAPVAGAGSAVTSKVTGMGNEAPQDRNESLEQDKGVSVTGYCWEEKLKPAEEDKALSNMITGTLNKQEKTEELPVEGGLEDSELAFDEIEQNRPMGHIAESAGGDGQEMDNLNGGAGIGMVDRIKGVVSSWLGGGGGDNLTTPETSYVGDKEGGTGKYSDTQGVAGEREGFRSE